MMDGTSRRQQEGGVKLLTELIREGLIEKMAYEQMRRGFPRSKLLEFSGRKASWLEWQLQRLLPGFDADQESQ